MNNPARDCPHCRRATASPLGPGGLCLLCAGTRALALDLGTDGEPETPAPAFDTAFPGLPEKIGPYEIIDELGAGGMARVFAARQPRLDRLVALKVVSSGHARADFAQRFLREAQTVARLRHPHIIALHDSGRAEGCLYFAMDFVEGGDLATRLRAGPFPPAAAAALVEKVAQGLAYAHAAGVLHRDLKPSNILLDGDEPLLADFGLAAARESGGDLTRESAVLGTPHYLAPEALLGGSAAMSVASDLYALGVVLYELLTGRTPHAGASPASLAGRIQQGEPAPPGRLQPGTPRDLETICLKCLERDPARRYTDAAALAEDLRRHRAGEPILARPLPPAARFVRWVRRRPALAALWFTVVLLAAGATAAATWINRERERADAEAVLAAVAATRAEAALRRANTVIAFLRDDLLAQASPDQQPDADIKLRTVLDRAAARVDDRFRNQPDLELTLREVLGVTYTGIGAYQTAHNHLTRALALAREKHGPDDDRVLTLEDQIANALMGLRRVPEAEAIKRRLHAANLHRLGPRARETLNLQNDIASLLNSQGKYAEAEALYRETLGTMTAALGADDPDTINCLNGLGVAVTRLGRLPEALQIARDVLARARARLGPDHVTTFVALMSLASIQGRQGEVDAAAELLEDGVARGKRVFGPDHPYTLNMMNSLAVMRLRQRRLDEAAPWLDAAFAGRLRVLGPDHPQTITTQVSLAGLARERGQLAEAARLFQDIAEKRTRLLGPEHPDTLRSLDALATLLGQLNRLPEARELQARALAARRRTLGDAHLETLESIRNTATGHLRGGDPAAAEALLRAALPAHDQTHPGGWPAAMARVQLGAALTRLGRLDEAGGLLREGHAGLKADEKRITAVMRPLLFAEAAGYFAEWHTAAGQPEEAAKWRAQAEAKK
jgi:tetratricopeptide (TPR) repeat protein